MLYNLIFDNFEVIIVLYCIVFVIDGIGNQKLMGYELFLNFFKYINKKIFI